MYADNGETGIVKYRFGLIIGVVVFWHFVTIMAYGISICQILFFE